MKAEGASLAEGPDALIVAAPREAKLQAFVFIVNAQPVPDRLNPSAMRQRILALAGEIENGAPNTDQ